MRKRYKLVLNIDITDPEQPFPAGGDYTRLNRIQGVVKLLTGQTMWPDGVVVSLDKLIDKGVLPEETKE